MTEKELNNKATHSSAHDPIMITMIFLLVIGLAESLWGLHSYEGKADQVQTAYQIAKAKSYVTVSDVKHILNKASEADESDNEVSQTLNDLNGSTVVDNSNGHEYIVTISQHRFADDSFSLAPKLNGKSAIVNRQWLAQHKNRN